MQFSSAAFFVALVLSAPVWGQEVPLQPAQENEDGRPQQIVATLHAGLLDIMKRGQELGFSGRTDVIGSVVREVFDVRILSGTAIGVANWRTWSPEQKETYVEVFTRFLIANYARQFKSFSGQGFEMVALEPGPKKTFLVKTHLNRPNKSPVKLTYLTREREGRIGIIDVYSGPGISEAGRRRGEFTSIYRSSGFDGLIASIESRIETFKSTAGEAEAG